MRPRSALVILGVVLSASALPVSAQSPAASGPLTKAVDPDLYAALKWRNIGPFRGGRCTAVAGVAAAPHTFYFGACGGGLWQTKNAGHSWTNISDSQFKTGSIGAIAVAPSDANVLYVGTGEAPVRGVTTTHGDGVYRSTDRGKTFTRVGLEASRHIAAIRVHPTDPDTLWVAAQGNPWAPSAMRGVYRSRDGGSSWQRVLFVNETTGAADLSLDPSNPRILFAAMWDHQRQPWQIRSGGPGSGLHRSVDAGATWQRLTKGLPKGLGKIGVVVSPADGQRVYAIVESDQGGLYRSDDGGDSWRRLCQKRVLRARSWYYMHIFADPVDADTVYVLNAPMMKSIDGGVTFTRIRNPHGDNHALWINPRRPQLMINGNDGGACVSLDGGASWSTQDNQPTAQFYRVATDNRVPFWVYGGQQDNSTVAIRSRTFGSGIGAGDWHSVGGGESAHIAFDSDNPRYVYATSILGSITCYDSATGHARSIEPYPQFVLGADARDYKFRFNWNPPVVVSQHDPKTIYFASNVLLRSRDRGQSWQPVSGDLTRNEDAKQGRGGVPYTNEAASAEVYNTIFYVAESSHTGDTIWVGSDDGLVHLTRDHGASWHNVTPKGLGETQINAIEASPHVPARAWLAVTGYKLDDFTPRIYVTDDYGKTWQERIAGLPGDTFVRVVREDPVRRGLVYAGTEAGMFVSFDDGTQWQTLQQNLPPVPITDLQVRQGSLVAATQGRAFWLLDDLAPLRALDDAVIGAAHHLFAPGDATRWRRRGGYTRKPGKNPSSGAVIRVLLSQVPDAAQQRVSLEIRDAAEHLVRSWSNQKSAGADAYNDNLESHRKRGEPYGLLQLKQGMNQLDWDLRRENVAVVPGHLVPSGWAGPRVTPGRYTVHLRVGDQGYTAPLTVRGDPRHAIAERDFVEYGELLDSVYADVNALHRMICRMRSVRVQLTALIDNTAGHATAAAIAEDCRAVGAKIRAWEASVIQEQRETQQDVANFENRLSMQLLALLSGIDAADPPVTQGARARFADLHGEWERAAARARSIIEHDVGGLNGKLQTRDVGPVRVPESRR